MKNWTKIKSKKGLIIYKDNKTGLLWAPPLTKKYSFNDANSIPQKILVNELGKFKNRAWGVPTREEIYIALGHGLLDLDPKFKGYFWSASVFSSFRNYAWFFDSYGNVDSYDRSNYDYQVRCVGR